MNPFAHPEVRETRGRPLSGEPVGRAPFSPIAVGPSGRNRSRRPIDPTIHPAGGSSLSSLAPHATGGVMAGWQARRHVCPRARSGASDPVLNVPPYLAGGFALPATFQTLSDCRRRVSEFRPSHLRIALPPLSVPSRQTGVFRCAKSSCTGAK